MNLDSAADLCKHFECTAYASVLIVLDSGLNTCFGKDCKKQTENMNLWPLHETAHVFLTHVMDIFGIAQNGTCLFKSRDGYIISHSSTFLTIIY